MGFHDDPRAALGSAALPSIEAAQTSYFSARKHERLDRTQHRLQPQDHRMNKGRPRPLRAETPIASCQCSDPPKYRVCCMLAGRTAFTTSPRRSINCCTVSDTSGTDHRLVELHLRKSRFLARLLGWQKRGRSVAHPSLSRLELITGLPTEEAYVRFSAGRSMNRRSTVGP